MTILGFLIGWLGAAALGFVVLFGVGTPRAWRYSVIAFGLTAIVLGSALA